jgi:hypothetical protein
MAIGMRALPYTLDTTFKVLEFFGRPAPGAEKMCDDQDQAYKA